MYKKYKSASVELFPDEKNKHQRQSQYGHCGTDREVYSEIYMSDDQVGCKQQSCAHCSGYDIVLAYIFTLAYRAAQIRYSK